MNNNPLPHLSGVAFFNFFTLGPSPKTLKKRWGRGGVKTLTKNDFRFNAPKNQKIYRGMGGLTSAVLNALTVAK